MADCPSARVARGAFSIAGLIACVLALACRDATGPRLPTGEFAYRSLADGGLWIMRPDGSDRRRVWFSPDDGAMCPSWSPDGSRIAFHKVNVNQVFVVEIATGQELQLTTGPELNHCPAWSPDGSRIALIRIPPSPATGYLLFVMNADGTNAVRLGSGTFVADRIRWSPDGTLIAASNWDNQITLVNTQTGATIVKPVPGGARGPDWSPDGQLITFQGERNGDQAIYVMDANGDGVRPVTDGLQTELYPLWTLDGRLITFSRYQYQYVSPSVTIAIGSLHLVALDGTEMPWSVGDAINGDLPMWRPNP